MPKTPNQGHPRRSTLAAVTRRRTGPASLSGKRPTPVTATSAFAMASLIARTGYRFAAYNGGVFSYGSGAPFLGSTGHAR